MYSRLLNFIDYFLPAYPVTREIRYRIRLLIVFLFLTFVVSALANLQYFQQNTSTRLLVFNSLIVLSNLIYPFLIKRSSDHEWISIIYFVEIYITNLISTTYFAPTVLHPSFQYFSFMLLFGFTFIVTPRKRMALVCISFSAIVASVLLIPDVTIVNVDGLDRIGAVQAITSFSIFAILLLMSTLVWFTYLQNASSLELASATQSHLLSLRLDEVSEPLKTLVNSLKKPIGELETLLSDLQQKDEGRVPDEDLGAMDACVQDAIHVAQSTGWIYRAYRSEPNITTKLYDFVKTVDIVLSGKMERFGWKVDIKVKTDDSIIHGSIPDIFLLIIMTAEFLGRYFEASSEFVPSQSRTLYVSILEESGKSLAIVLGTKPDNGLPNSLSPANPRFAQLSKKHKYLVELIEDLVSSSQTTLKRLEVENGPVVVIGNVQKT